MAHLTTSSKRAGAADLPHAQPAAPSLISRLWYRLIKATCSLVARVLFRFRVIGAENVPAHGAALLLANHASHLDPVLVGIACPRQLRFLARHTLFFWPLGWLIDSLGAVPINRESGIAGLRATLQILKRQEALLLFPEGTRSHDGRLQPLQPGFCAVARRSQAALVPIGIAGSFAALPRARKFPRPERITLQFAPPIPYSEYADLSDDGLIELVSTRLAAVVESAAGTPAGSTDVRTRDQGN